MCIFVTKTRLFFFLDHNKPQMTDLVLNLYTIFGFCSGLICRTWDLEPEPLRFQTNICMYMIHISVISPIVFRIFYSYKLF